MARFKKGSKEAKAYMAKIRGKKGPVKKAAVKKVSGLDKVVRRGKKTDVKYTRVSGIGTTISKIEREYLVMYDFGNDVSVATFKATSLAEAKRIAVLHKRHTPELMKKKIRTFVKLKR